MRVERRVVWWRPAAKNDSNSTDRKKCASDRQPTSNERHSKKPPLAAERFPYYDLPDGSAQQQSGLRPALRARAPR